MVFESPQAHPYHATVFLVSAGVQRQVTGVLKRFLRGVFVRVWGRFLGGGWGYCWGGFWGLFLGRFFGYFGGCLLVLSFGYLGGGSGVFFGWGVVRVKGKH